MYLCGIHMISNMRQIIRPYVVQAAFESIFDKNAAVLDLPLEVFDEDRVEPMTPGSTRTEMPVFMLDVSACPGGVVPLHIFEMRYRQVSTDRPAIWRGIWEAKLTLLGFLLMLWACRSVAGSHRARKRP